MMTINPIRAMVAVAFALPTALALAAGPADAQLDAARRYADQLQRQEQERLRAEREASQNLPAANGADLKSLLPAPKPVSPADTGCHQIKHIEISGSTLLGKGELSRLLAGFEGRCLATSDLENLLGELTRHYILAGWVASRAYLPPQQLSSGTLKVHINEGRIERITSQDGGDGSSVRLGTAFPGLTGKPLNLRDLEQGIEQLNRVPGNRAVMDVRPGSRPGDSEVVIVNTPGSRFGGSLSWDNQGSRATGQEQVGVALNAGHLLGLNEVWSLSHRENLDRDPQRKQSLSDSISLSLPYGYSLLTLSSSQGEHASTVRTPGGLDLKFSGSSRNDSVRLDHTVLRGQSQILQLSANLTLKDSKSYIADQLLEVSSRKLSVLDLEAGWNDILGGAAVSVRAGYSMGLKGFGAQQDVPGLNDETPRAQFGKYTLSATLNQPFSLLGMDGSLFSQLSAQKSATALYGSEQISIGGLYSVRGFRNNSLSGDDGYYLRNTATLRRQVALLGQTVGLRLFAGIDGGRVSSRAQDVPSGSMVGATVGLGLQYGPASWELSHARAVSQPGQMPKEGGQTWASVSIGF